MVQPCVCNSWMRSCAATAYRAHHEETSGAEGQGVAIDTVFCLCQKNSMEADCGKGKAGSYLSAKDDAHVPCAWPIGEKGCLLGRAKLGQNVIRLVRILDVLLA